MSERECSFHTEVGCSFCRGSVAQGAAKPGAGAQEEADEARKRFGNAKSISSSQFNADDSAGATDHEKQVGGAAGPGRVC